MPMGRLVAASRPGEAIPFRNVFLSSLHQGFLRQQRFQPGYTVSVSAQPAGVNRIDGSGVRRIQADYLFRNTGSALAPEDCLSLIMLNRALNGRAGL